MIISNRLFGLTIALGCSLLVASVGASLTEIGPWYLALKQPSWKPPDFAFGIIWSAIFTLCAFSGWGLPIVPRAEAATERGACAFG